jgi:hypothetical protein
MGSLVFSDRHDGMKGLSERGMFRGHGMGKETNLRFVALGTT